ncbi:MAG: hypothetical protein DMG99_00105 [Acidobacteria bacterium]|nr:MAG: hypothetical protein DMG99_00105 [Acidobacteriota bacterium]
MECPHCYRQIKAEAKSCPACGGYIPPGQHLLDAAGLSQAETPKPEAPAASSRSGCYAPRLAKLGDRFNAFLLDTVVLFGLFAMADAWIFMRWSSFENAELSLTAASLLAVLVANAAIFFIYTCVLEASCGATVGKNRPSRCVVRGSNSKPAALCGCRRLIRDWRNCGRLFAMAAAPRRSLRRNHGCGATVRNSFQNRRHRFDRCGTVRSRPGCAQNLLAREWQSTRPVFEPGPSPRGKN